MTRLAQAAVAATRLGQRTRWLWQSPADVPPENVNLTARLQVAMPGCYRIDTVTDPGTKAATTACDGNRLWLVYPDRIAVRPAAPLPDGVSPILDPAWLLREHPLTAEETVTDSGHPALRVDGRAHAEIRLGTAFGHSDRGRQGRGRPSTCSSGSRWRRSGTSKAAPCSAPN